MTGSQKWRYQESSRGVDAFYKKPKKHATVPFAQKISDRLFFEKPKTSAPLALGQVLSRELIGSKKIHLHKMFKFINDLH